MTDRPAPTTVMADTRERLEAAERRIAELERIVDLIRDSAHEHDTLSRDGMLYVDTHEGEER